MELKSMKCEPGENEMPKPMMMGQDGPEYPYGLRLDLNSHVLKKLGMGELPPVGSIMKLEATVEVCCASMHDRKGGEPEMSIGLQITELALEKGSDKSQNPEDKFYSKNEQAEG